jgi:hypothetical protein
MLRFRETHELVEVCMEYKELCGMMSKDESYSS